ncbi:MAG: hypothetical protein HQK49_09815 [Oligoflexia bacterium]|nr:hypothetical protein [Oligoflexia bacterium]
MNNGIVVLANEDLEKVSGGAVASEKASLKKVRTSGRLGGIMAPIKPIKFPRGTVGIIAYPGPKKPTQDNSQE